HRITRQSGLRCRIEPPRALEALDAVAHRRERFVHLAEAQFEARPRADRDRDALDLSLELRVRLARVRGVFEPLPARHEAEIGPRLVRLEVAAEGDCRSLRARGALERHGLVALDGIVRIGVTDFAGRPTRARYRLAREQEAEIGRRAVGFDLQPQAVVL